MLSTLVRFLFTADLAMLVRTAASSGSNCFDSGCFHDCPSGTYVENDKAGCCGGCLWHTHTCCHPTPRPTPMPTPRPTPRPTPISETFIDYSYDWRSTSKEIKDDYFERHFTVSHSFSLQNNIRRCAYNTLVHTRSLSHYRSQPSRHVRRSRAPNVKCLACVHCTKP